MRPRHIKLRRQVYTQSRAWRPRGYSGFGSTSKGPGGMVFSRCSESSSAACTASTRASVSVACSTSARTCHNNREIEKVDRQSGKARHRQEAAGAKALTDSKAGRKVRGLEDNELKRLQTMLKDMDGGEP